LSAFRSAWVRKPSPADVEEGLKKLPADVASASSATEAEQVEPKTPDHGEEKVAVMQGSEPVQKAVASKAAVDDESLAGELMHVCVHVCSNLSTLYCAQFSGWVGSDALDMLRSRR
jgi:hypothetical protein